jgi:hypothetical protein
MSDTESQALRRDFETLREEVHAMHGTLGIIHQAVVSMAGKTYVPGPRRRSWWSKVGSIFGCLI